MIVINYLQSFLENGLVNACGYLYADPGYSANATYKYDFNNKQWVANSTGNIINLDENGVANGLFKLKSYGSDNIVNVYDASGNFLRYISLPPWDEEFFEAELSQAMASLDLLNEKKSITEYWVGLEHEDYNNPFDLTQELPTAGIALILKNFGDNASFIKYLDSFGNPVTNMLVKNTFIPIFFNEQGWGFPI